MTFILKAIFLVSLPFLLNAGIDSGGGQSAVGGYQNHSSIGAAFATSASVLGGNDSHSGIIEVIYAPVIHAIVDVDSDGMDDRWEDANRLNVGENDSASDLDGDGVTALMEFLAGSDPNDSNSNLKPTIESDGARYFISIHSQLQRNYRFWVSVDLETWVHWIDHSGTGESMTFTFDPSSSEALSAFSAEALRNCFFRIELSFEH